MAVAVNRLIALGGGFVVAAAGQVTAMSHVPDATNATNARVLVRAMRSVPRRRPNGWSGPVNTR